MDCINTIIIEAVNARAKFMKPRAIAPDIINVMN